MWSFQMRHGERGLHYSIDIALMAGPGLDGHTDGGHGTVVLQAIWQSGDLQKLGLDQLPLKPGHSLRLGSKCSLGSCLKSTNLDSLDLSWSPSWFYQNTWTWGDLTIREDCRPVHNLRPSSEMIVHHLVLWIQAFEQNRLILAALLLDRSWPAFDVVDFYLVGSGRTWQVPCFRYWLWPTVTKKGSSVSFIRPCREASCYSSLAKGIKTRERESGRQ